MGWLPCHHSNVGYTLVFSKKKANRLHFNIDAIMGARRIRTLRKPEEAPTIADVHAAVSRCFFVPKAPQVQERLCTSDFPRHRYRKGFNNGRDRRHDGGGHCLHLPPILHFYCLGGRRRRRGR